MTTILGREQLRSLRPRPGAAGSPARWSCAETLGSANSFICRVAMPTLQLVALWAGCFIAEQPLYAAVNDAWAARNDAATTAIQTLDLTHTVIDKGVIILQWSPATPHPANYVRVAYNQSDLSNPRGMSLIRHQHGPDTSSTTVSWQRLLENAQFDRDISFRIAAFTQAHNDANDFTRPIAVSNWLTLTPDQIRSVMHKGLTDGATVEMLANAGIEPPVLGVTGKPQPTAKPQPTPRAVGREQRQTERALPRASRPPPTHLFDDITQQSALSHIPQIDAAEFRPQMPACYRGTGLGGPMRDKATQLGVTFAALALKIAELESRDPNLLAE